MLRQIKEIMQHANNEIMRGRERIRSRFYRSILNDSFLLDEDEACLHIAGDDNLSAIFVECKGTPFIQLITYLDENPDQSMKSDTLSLEDAKDRFMKMKNYFFGDIQSIEKAYKFLKSVDDKVKIHGFVTLKDAKPGTLKNAISQCYQDTFGLGKIEIFINSQPMPNIDIFFDSLAISEIQPKRFLAWQEHWNTITIPDHLDQVKDQNTRKTLTLLAKYSGFLNNPLGPRGRKVGLLCSFHTGRHHVENITSVIGAYFTKPSLSINEIEQMNKATVKNILSELNKKIGNNSIELNGDFFNLMRVIKNNSGIDYFSDFDIEPTVVSQYGLSSKR